MHYKYCVVSVSFLKCRCDLQSVFLSFHMFGSTKPFFLVLSKICRLAQEILNMISADVLTEIQHLLVKLQFDEGWYNEFVTRKTCSGSFYIWVADVSFQITIYTRYTTNFWYPRINNNVVKTFAVSVKKLSDTQGYSLIFRAKVAFFLSRKNQLWKCFWKVI